MSLNELLPKQDYSKLLHKESRVYKQIILHRWAAIDCRRLGVRFERIDVSQTAIHYKIAISYQNIFRVWKTALPKGVYVADLISDKTLHELSLACQRLVTADHNINGVWIIVHRVSSEYNPRQETQNLLDELRDTAP